MRRLRVNVDGGRVAAEWRTERQDGPTPEEKLEAAVRIISALSCAAVVIASLVLAGPITLLPVSVITVIFVAVRLDE